MTAIVNVAALTPEDDDAMPASTATPPTVVMTWAPSTTATESHNSASKTNNYRDLAIDLCTPDPTQASVTTNKDKFARTHRDVIRSHSKSQKRSRQDDSNPMSTSTQTTLGSPSTAHPTSPPSPHDWLTQHHDMLRHSPMNSHKPGWVIQGSDDDYDHISPRHTHTKLRPELPINYQHHDCPSPSLSQCPLPRQHVDPRSPTKPRERGQGLKNQGNSYDNITNQDSAAHDKSVQDERTKKGVYVTIT
ncbi:hypothetical protein EDB83DRAFT_2327843 [Lactarius deliciosus]|nr:hypothetical protein EDB83DRAFT_2327843 [Lactarius deliciosus]